MQPVTFAATQPLTSAFIRDHVGDDHPDATSHRRRFADGWVGADPGLATPQAGRQLLETAIADARDDYQAFVAESQT